MSNLVSLLKCSNTLWPRWLHLIHVMCGPWPSDGKPPPVSLSTALRRPVRLSVSESGPAEPQPVDLANCIPEYHLSGRGRMGANVMCVARLRLASPRQNTNAPTSWWFKAFPKIFVNWDSLSQKGLGKKKMKAPPSLPQGSVMQLINPSEAMLTLFARAMRLRICL